MAAKREGGTKVTVGTPEILKTSSRCAGTSKEFTGRAFIRGDPSGSLGRSVGLGALARMGFTMVDRTRADAPLSSVACLAHGRPRDGIGSFRALRPVAPVPKSGAVGTEHEGTERSQ